MDILNKYSVLIAESIDGAREATFLKDEHVLNSAAYYTLLEMDDPFEQSHELLEIIKAQNNQKAAARLFQAIQQDYRDIANMIPELSSGERFSQNLGDDVDLKVMVHDGEVLVAIARIPVS